ncbi:MAG: zinc ribbon domain-containing protein [Betaproteobacteria bacterium]|nr:zinc ribbon domain-containing protein [Betaproteobacteria bacterium]
MKHSTSQSGFPSGGGHPFLRLRFSLALLAAVLLPAIAAAAGGNAPKGNPRLASLGIDIWPEYDRPAVLVILKGELASNVALPAAVSVRIPARSGGPSAVAFSSEAGGNLLTAKYDSGRAGDYITVKFQVPQRIFHIEFYDPIVTSTPERKYTYVWPGDLATDRLSVIVQEPAGTLDLSVTPSLDATATGQDGLRYRSAQLGAFEAGKQLPVRVAYTKTDSRTSTEISRPQADGSLPSDSSTASSLPALSSPPAMRTGETGSGWFLALAVALPLGIAAGAAFLLWRRRAAATAAPRGGGRFCPQCGAQADSGDRFCSKCGAALK